jgi:hypothetical protein
VTTELPVVGDHALFFEPAPVTYRGVEGLPAEAQMQVPTAFEEVVAQGTTWAGGRVWTHDDGEVALWWTPGPTEELLLSNAVVVLEAALAADPRYETIPTLTEAEPITWDGWPGFEFPERWPDAEGGVGRAWVVQGPGFWLYTLRVRALQGDELPPVHRAVAQRFTLAAPE